MKTARVLIVDDDFRERDLVAKTLRDAGFSAVRCVAGSEAKFRAALSRFAPDIILSEISFCDFDPLFLLKIARQTKPEIPVIFVTGAKNEGRAIFAMREGGATDYFLKPNLLRLPDAVSRALKAARESSRRVEAERRVSYFSRLRDLRSALNAAILKLHDQPDLFEEACRVATSVGGFVFTFVVTIDPESSRVDVPAVCGTPTLDREAMRTLLQRHVDRLEGAPGVFAESLRTLRAAIINDVSGAVELPNLKALLASGVTGIGSFPLVVGGKAVGAIVFAAREPGFFDAIEVDLLSNLTGNLSFALELGAKQRRVEYLAYYDQLTGLPNRTLFLERLQQAILAAGDTGNKVALLLIDISESSERNSALGERGVAGVLRELGDRLRKLGESRAARVADHKFAVWFEDLRDLKEIPVTSVMTEGGMRILNRPFRVEGRDVTIGATTGWAVAPSDGASADALFRSAEIALATARARGTAYEFYSRELGVRVARRIGLESRLRGAVERSEFILHYQPVFDALGRRLTGLEALIRWVDPEDPGLQISAAEFVPVLEQTRLIVPVGRWVLHEVARQRAQWRRDGREPPRVAVNISPVQLRDDHILNDLREAFIRGGERGGIDIEITENVLVDDPESAITLLRAMRDMGVEIALDDFGTGYSSLTYLRRLPISVLKIDRSFVSGMTDDLDKTTIVASIISLAHAMRLTVVAEGVETQAEAHLLQAMGCDRIQGYLTGRPASAETIASLLEPRR